MGRKTNKQRRDRQAASAREKAAAARAIQARADQQRRAKAILSTVVAAAVVIAVVTVVAINRPVKNTAEGNRRPAPAALVDAVTGVSPATYNQVGVGSAKLSSVRAVNDPALTEGGKPEVLFIGAEFCPFCAAERWSLVQALSRFGTLTNLNQIRSATSDENLATFSFYKSGYTSKYISLVAIENTTRSKQQLVPVTNAQQALWSKYTPGYPFVDFGGKFVITSAGFTESDLHGLTWTQIAAALKDPTSTLAKDILGEANVITAMICNMTNGRPSNICQASGVSGITLPQASA